MTRAATTRLKVNPPLGRLPVLTYLPPAEMQIDPAYQRSIAGADSQALIRKIAQHWNWDLCQPLVVARRDGGALFVIDGQHRLAAARRRGDIAQLPAVVVDSGGAGDEAASFVHLNQQRKPLQKLDIFKAAVASGDGEAGAILAAITAAGLSLAPHQNYVSWKPGQLANIGGIEASWRRHGPAITAAALRALAEGLGGEVLRYAGSIFPGIAAVCALEMKDSDGEFAFDVWDADVWDAFVAMIAGAEQTRWRSEIMQARAANPNLRFNTASEAVFLAAWRELLDALLEEDD